MKKQILLSISLLLFCVGAFSANKMVKPNIKLDSISVQQTQEKAGDELYMTVTTYPSSGKAIHKEVPHFPHYWLSTHLKQVKNLSLWSGKLANGEGITLMISLIERDSPPWNVDDHIGSIEVMLKNEGGKIKSTWKIPNRSDAKVEKAMKRKLRKTFQFVGAKKSKYTIKLSLATR